MRLDDRNAADIPWAYATSPDTSLMAGQRYRYFTSRRLAEKSRDHRILHRRFAGEIEYRPGECFEIGGGI